jgi:hypothetical protein
VTHMIKIGKHSLRGTQKVSIAYTCTRYEYIIIVMELE